MSIGIEEEDRCFFEGEKAFLSDLKNKSITTNPYDKFSNHLRYEHWNAGYCNASSVHCNDFQIIGNPCLVKVLSSDVNGVLYQVEIPK